MAHNKPIDVHLRLWSDDDLPLLMRLMGDPAMTAYLGGPESAEKIRERHQGYCHNSVEEKDPIFAIIVEPEGIAVGSIGYWEKAWFDETVWETGWSVLPEFQGYGIATKAAALIVERARLEKKFRFLHAFPSFDNAASNAICRKSGFLLRGMFNFEYPPGNLMCCNDWSFDLFADEPRIA